uniref:FBA_2 domain-containing protein n=1 Tax=Caenorhabditis tropicalis TaxID=1561998 RepID=A0A1I7UGM1_9PELO
MATEKKRNVDYNTLKVIMKHLDPNVRIHISRRIPTLRNLDKIVPLKPEKVILGKYTTEIDDTTYKVGIFRQFNHQFPFYESVSNQNMTGGVQLNLDQWGLHPNLMPERELQHNMWMNSWSLGVFTSWFGFDVDRCNEPKAASLGDPYILDHQRKMQDISLLQHLYICRRNQIPPPFSMKIMVTISRPSGTERFYYPYDRTLEEAMDEVNMKIFGVRRTPQVDHLTLDSFNLDQKPDFKFLVKNLKFTDYVARNKRQAFIHLCQKFIHKGNFPLDFLQIDCDFHAIEDLAQVKTARKIHIDRIENDLSWFDNLSNMSNSVVHVAKNANILTPEDCILVYEKWMRDGRSIGTCHTYGLRDEQCALEILEIVRVRINEEKIEDRWSITVPVNSTSCIHISIHIDYTVWAYRFILRMEIVPIPWDFS